MKMLKKPFVLMTVLLLSSVVLFSGCKKDEEEDRKKFLGLYNVVETCGSGNDSYEMTIIESGTGDNAVILGGLYLVGLNVSATVNGNNINIASQNVQDVTVVGNGSISGNTLSMTFTVSASGVGADNCSLVATRR